MRRRLIIGLGLITLIFVLSGAIVLRNLSAMTRQQQLAKQHAEIVSHYETMLYLMRSAQTELYRHQAGYSRNIDDLVDHMLEFEDMLSLTKSDYLLSRSRSECAGCHSRRENTSDHMLVRMTNYLNDYEEKISLIVISKDVSFAGSLEKGATSDGEKIVDVISNLRGRTELISKRIEKSQKIEMERSRYLILIALLLGIVLAAVVGTLLLRSITRPVDLLVKGITKVSSGDFGSTVAVSSDDEIGFLASAFNAMASNLGRMNEQRETLLEDLRELNNSLEQRVKEAAEQLRIAHERMLRNETLSAVGTFASGVAHELATPLSSVLSYFQIVKKRIAADEKLAGDVSLIEGELVRCRSILRGMLDFARAPETDKSPTNVNVIVLELLALVQYQREYRGITVVTKLDDGVPDVIAVPGQMKQVFLNIILNALQSMGEGGVLTVSSFLKGEGDGRMAAVGVTDTGPGISDEVMNKIFQPFYTTKEAGTGLGLSISYGIVRGHGGDIEVRSEAGKGTTFYVYLPVKVNHEGSEDKDFQDGI